MDPITAGLVAGGMGLIGSSMTNQANTDIAQMASQFNAQQSQQQRDWQEHMRATQYQTTVDDLQKAGLNPMLAYQQGGAGIPSGAVATAAQAAPRQNVLGTAADKFLSSATTNADLKLKDEQQKLNSAQTANTQAATLKTIADTAKTNQDTATGAAVENVNKAQLNAIAADIGMKNAATAASHAQAAKTIVETARTKQEANIRAPEEAKSKTWWGRNISPYIQDFSRGASSAASAAGALR
jgi:hypothetical protein